MSIFHFTSLAVKKSLLGVTSEKDEVWMQVEEIAKEIEKAC